MPPSPQISLPLEKLVLKDAKPFNKGGHCLLYAHPACADLVVRVVSPDYVERSSTLLRRKFNRRFGHLVDFQRLASEFIFSHLTPKRPSFLQDFCCFVETDLGLGVVVKAERGKDGNYAPALNTLLKNGTFDDTAAAALERFFVDLLASDIIVGDLRSGNLVLSHDAATGESRFVIVDGLGEKTGIPICSWFRFFNVLAKKRHIRRIRSEISRTAPAV